MEDLKENVLQATIDVFKEKGIKFTMDDIAKKLSISKKTIYTVTQNKNSLIKEMKGCKIQDAWKADSDERTCSACDFRTFCKNNSVNAKDFKIP